MRVDAGESGPGAGGHGKVGPTESEHGHRGELGGHRGLGGRERLGRLAAHWGSVRPLESQGGDGLLVGMGP